MEDGEPIVVRVETLTSGWDSTLGTVFEFEETLIEQLTELAQAQGQGPTHMRPQVEPNANEVGEAAVDSPLGDEDWDQTANASPQVETLLEAVRGGVAPVRQRIERT